MSDQERATKICDDLLEITGRAIMTGDFSSFLPYFELPQIIGTFDGDQLICTSNELEKTFDAVRNHYLANRVTLLFRKCIAAKFVTKTTIKATHEVRLLNGTQMVQAPFPVYATLHLSKNIWKIGDTQYAIADAPDHNLALKVTL